MVKRRTWKPAESYCKGELGDLINRVKGNDSDAIEEAIAFTVRESFGIWHGRARASICRNLRNKDISEADKDLLVECICNRLLSGNFSEQFKEQLTMAVRFRPDELLECALQALKSDKEYIRRYGAWVENKVHTWRVHLESERRRTD